MNGTSSRNERRVAFWPTVAVCSRVLLRAVVGWLPGASAGAAAQEATLPFVIATPGGVPNVPITVWVGSADGGERTLTLPPDARAGAATAAGPPPWQLRLLVADFWSATHTVYEPPDAPLRLELWPAGGLALEVDAAGASPPPTQVGVALTAARDGLAGQPGAAEAPCRLEDGQVSNCPLPAGVWHVRLEVGALAPHVAWEVIIPARGRLDLGRVVFLPGATLVGNVVAPPGVAVEATTVNVAPARDVAALGTAARQGLAAASRKVAVDGWGRFAMAGVAPGAWAVLAQHPECPAPPLVVAVERSAGVIELPQPLTLRCPAAVEVRVTPPEAIPASGLQVELLARGGNQTPDTPLASGEIPAGGLWRSPPLPPGRLLVVLSAPDGAVLGSREVELEGQELAVEIPLELVLVEGRLLKGRRGVAAKLDFIGADGATAAAQADEEGRFFASFPRPGRFRPFVTPQGRAQLLALEPVEITAGATLTVRLPHTRLRGEVRQADGVSPAPGAQLELTAADGAPTATTTADEAGRFELRGVPEGRGVLAATADERRSRPLDVEILEGRENFYVLLLDDPLVVRCRVLGAGAPLAGVHVAVWAADTAARLLPGDPSFATTEADGVAAVALVPGTARAALTVLAPGFALYEAAAQPLPAGGEPLVVTLAQLGGTLLLDPSAGEEESAPLLLKDGQLLLASAMLGHWAALHGKPPAADREWEIPMMPPGRYRLCRATAAEAVAVRTGHAVPRASSCSPEGDLAPAGVLRLYLP